MERPNLDRVPRKIESYIEHLERALKSARATLDERLGVADQNTKVFVHNYNLNPDRPLPEFGLVRFRMGDGFDEYIDVQRNMDSQGGGVVIRSGRSISLEPRASNTALVHLVKR